MARTITIAADAAPQDALSKLANHERKSLADVARELLEAAVDVRPHQARFGARRGPLLFTESVNAWQRALLRRNQS